MNQGTQPYGMASPVIAVKKGDYIRLTASNINNAADGGFQIRFRLPVAIAAPTTNDTYSTSEVNTGKTWIDGLPIYRRVFTGTTPASNSLSITLMSGMSVPTIVAYGGIVSMNAGGTYLALGTYADATSYTFLNLITTGGTGTTSVNLAGQRTTAIAGPYKIWIEYTKP